MITKDNIALLPRTEEFFDRLDSARFFYELHLENGFRQIGISPGYIAKSAFKSNYGHVEFLEMVIGLRNAPVTFQALMNPIFRNFIDEVIVIYLDDILIFSDDHLRHLRLFLKHQGT